MSDYLLNGFRALDLTDEKGFACGKILASFGIDTIKIERPGGDLSRNTPPVINATEGQEISLNWLAYNTDKRSITLDIETATGQNIFRKLVEKSDFIIESFTPGYMEKLGLDYESLSRVNPRIIMVSITPFGQKGPYSHFKGSELIVSAMSGVMDTNGDPKRAPLREGPDAITFRSCAAAAIGSLIAHYYREQTGEGQQVDISMQEVAVSRTTSNLVVWEFDKKLIKRNNDIRTVGARSTRWIWKCKDGYVFWPYMGGPGGAPANRAVSQWLDDEGLENPLKKVRDWDEFDFAAISKEEVDIHQEAIAKLFMKHTKKEIAEEALKRGTRSNIIQNPVDVLEDEQLKARDYWTFLEHPELGFSLKYPKYFFRSNRTENDIKRRAPTIGEHNEEVFGELIGLSKLEIAELKTNKVI